MTSETTQGLSQDVIKEFVIASHFNLQKVQEMLTQNPELLTVEYDWGQGRPENGVSAAGHVGNRDIAEFFLAQQRLF